MKNTTAKRRHGPETRIATAFTAVYVVATAILSLIAKSDDIEILVAWGALSVAIIWGMRAIETRLFPNGRGGMMVLGGIMAPILAFPLTAVAACCVIFWTW